MSIFYGTLHKYTALLSNGRAKVYVSSSYVYKTYVDIHESRLTNYQSFTILELFKITNVLVLHLHITELLLAD